MDVLSTAGSVVGLVGGLSGLWAFGRQEVALRRTRKNRHLPPEMRSVLLKVVSVTDGFFRRADDSHAWAEANIQPIREEWNGLRRIAFRDYTEPGSNEAISLSHGLNSMRRWSIRPDGTTLSEGVDRDRARALQFAGAQQAEEAAKALLDLMDGRR